MQVDNISAFHLQNVVPKNLWAKYIKPDRIPQNDRMAMFRLMREYYADVTQEQFITDLLEKTDVIVLRDELNEIRGFSTLLTQDQEGAYGKVRVIFSGDTVVDARFWGQRQLGAAFLKYLFIDKLKNPLVPVYWMLMSKGYKTYLIMANNFGVHFPRYEQETPSLIQDIMNDFYGSKFGAAYNQEAGLIVGKAKGCRLRDGVAPLTGDLRIQFPRIDFFARRNPDWESGVELACIAEMKFSMPIYYFFKKLVRTFLGR